MLLSAPAAAETTEDSLTTAQSLFDEGIHLFNLGRFEDACPKFEASLALVAGIGTRGKLAECYEKLGRTASAWRLYREVEGLAARTGDDLRRRVARQRIRALEPLLARMTVVPGPSVAVPGFEVLSNGRPIEPRTFTIEQFVDPGMYVIVAQAPERLPWTSEVRIDSGQRVTVRVPALAPLVEERSSGAVAGRRAGQGLVIAGAAVAVGGGAYFGWRANDYWNQAGTHCDAELRCDPQGQSLAAAANRNANYANIAVAVGGAAVAAGALLWLSSRDQGGDATAGVGALLDAETVGLSAWVHF